ncbi:MAG: NAD(P)-dependent malic enzyme [Candidatus Nanoarchaeia archaeon]
MKTKNYDKKSLKLHEKTRGKISIVSKMKLKNKEDLSVAYTPGVAAPCREIAKDRTNVYKYTLKHNSVAVVTDGTAVLGLGDIGPEASLPVMEGKAVLFKKFADIDAFPIALDTKNVDEIVKTVKFIAPAFGGINLEDISAPRCFEIEKRLKEELDIPVFHDDQHGTAIVVLAGLINSLKLAGKECKEIKVVVSGAGAAGEAIVHLLISRGLKNVIVVDRAGAIYMGRKENMNPEKEHLAKITNPNLEQGRMEDVIKNADVFVGVSAPGLLTKEMVKTMAEKSIIFAMANPLPEIMPEEAKEAGAFIVATGRSDFPNQLNNVLAFPGIFRGALDVRAREINEEMKLAAAEALANAVIDISVDKIIPDPFAENLAVIVAEAVKTAAIETKVNRI